MKPVLAIWFVVGCAFLSWVRIPDFSSDRALWWSALPSMAPRVHVNVAAALIRDGVWESGGLYALAALEYAERPVSAYEREAVQRIVRNQLWYIDTFYPICDRPAYSPHC